MAYLKSTNIFGTLKIHALTQSTSSTTGSLVVMGGAGVNKSLFVKEAINVTGNATIGGTVNGLKVNTATGKTLDMANASLTVGTAATNTGAVKIQSAGTSTTTIIGPNGGTATLVSGTMVPTTRTITINSNNGITGGSATASSLSANRAWTLGLTGQAKAFHDLSTNGIVARTNTNTVAARTITGTTNRIYVSKGDGVAGNPTIDISSSYVGQDTITTLGTITTGEWSADATTIAVNAGGTGETSYTNGQILIGKTTGNTLVKGTLTGIANQIKVTNGEGTITLSTPQDIHAVATPQFSRMGLGAEADGTANLKLSTGTILSNVADSSTAKGFTLTTTSYSAAGAKLFSVVNGTSEKFSIDKDGNITANNLTINGTTTTVNSTTVTIDDPVFTLGGDTAPTKDDNKDRGIEFRYFDTTSKLGFFGYDNSTDKFKFLTNATNTSEVFSGTKGVIVANLDGNVNGNLTGNVIGNVTGDVNGDLTGNVIGNVTGNLTGNVIGTTNIIYTTPTTNTTTFPLAINSQSSGTPAIGIGTGIRFITETTAGNNEAGSTIESISTDVTSGSEDFDLVFKTMAGGTSATEVVRITSDDKVKISGSLTVTGTITESSDRRLKTEIKDISNALDKVKTLTGYTFKKANSDKVSMGLIAQDTQKVIPEVVNEGSDGYLGIQYSNIVALLIEAIKEQQEQIDYLKSKKDKKKWWKIF